jgi:predicted CXXCH cytochrome family protein
LVGWQSCRSCHVDEFQRWSGSQHQRAMQHARSGTVLGDFENASFVYGKITSTFFRRGGKYFVRTDAADGTLKDFEVKYTFGVEPLQQYLVEMPDGRVQALPVAWDSRSKAEGGQRWFHLYPGQGIEHADPLHWTGRMQNWNFMCADCHSTNVQKGYDPATDRFRTTWSEISVGCEACHGPGSRHEKWASAPGLVRALLWRGNGLTAQLTERRGVHWATDSTTGLPRRSVPRTTNAEVEVCAQCHSRRAQVAEGHVAGAPFHDSYIPDLIVTGIYHADGQQRDEDYTYGSFLQSRMFHAGVTCSDCHDPHTQTLRAPGNAVCTQCHTPARFDTPAHTMHPTGSQGAQCVSCHMPATTYMQVDPRRDHSIRVPRPDQTVSLGVPNACNACHTDRSAAWAAQQVRSRWGHDPQGFQRFAEAFAADDSARAAAPAALAGVAQDATEPPFVRASALARLAGSGGPAERETARLSLGDPDPMVRRAALLALEQTPPEERVAVAAPLLRDSSRIVRLQAAWMLAPISTGLTSDEDREAFTRAAGEFVASQRFNADRPENRITLGNFFAQMGRVGEAAAEYRAAIHLAPRFSAAYVNLADLMRTAGREADAERTLREGLAEAPDDADLHHALGLSLARSGRLADAVAELGRASALAPDRPDLAYAYAVGLHSAGRVREAIATLETALGRHPSDHDLLFALATFHRDAGEIDAAIRYAERLAAVSPGDPEASGLLRSLQQSPSR